MPLDYYKILGVLDDAEDIVIKAAYRALSQRYHPDKWSGNKKDAEEKMRELNEAYSVLSDPLKRREYDSKRNKNEYSEDKLDNVDNLFELIDATKRFGITTINILFEQVYSSSEVAQAKRIFNLEFGWQEGQDYRLNTQIRDSIFPVDLDLVKLNKKL